MAYNDGLVTAPVSMKDVENAVGVPQSAGLMAQCMSPTINPMAKYKPVRYNKKAELTLSEFKATRFGFGSTVPTFTGGLKEPSVTWEYQKIRNNTDWARITDFDGYFNRATVPFAFDVSGALGDGVGLSFYVNSSAASYYSDHGHVATWDEEHGLSITDLFTNSQNVSSSSYLAVCIHDLVKGDSIVVVTNKRIVDLSYVTTVTLYATQMTISGVTYPAVAMLNDSLRNGNNFRFIVGLVSNPPANGAPYQVFTDITTPAASAITLWSLAISAGVDRVEKILTDTHTIMGLECQISRLSSTMTYKGIDSERNMHKYILEADVMGVITTPTGHWSPEGGNIGIRLVVSANGWVGDDASQGSMQFGTEVSVPLNNHTYYFSPMYQFRNIPVYFYQGTGSYEVYIDATATAVYEEVPFKNTLTITP